MQTTATALKPPIAPHSWTAPSETFTGKTSIFTPEMVNIVAPLQKATFKCLNKTQLNPRSFLDHN